MVMPFLQRAFVVMLEGLWKESQPASAPLLGELCGVWIELPSTMKA